MGRPIWSWPDVIRPSIEPAKRVQEIIGAQVLARWLAGSNPAMTFGTAI